MATLPRLARWARYAWAAPTTAAGLPFVLAAVASRRGGSAAIVDGVVEVSGGPATWFLRSVTPRVTGGRGASAMTLGHVVIGRDADDLARTRPHERVHVRQVERWGPLFLPAYLAASATAWRRGGHYYNDNAFEREAYDADPAGPAT